MIMTLEKSTKFKNIIEDENELIDVQRLVVLFKSVTPKLLLGLNELNDKFLLKWSAVKQRLRIMGRFEDGSRFINGIEMVYSNHYQGFMRNIDSFKDVSQKFADRLESQIQCNEKELLVMIFESKSLIPSIFDLLKDVDSLEDDINSIFSELMEFLDEISLHFESLHYMSLHSSKEI